MEHKQLSTIDLIVETHIGLERQGPGSADATLLALSFIDNLGKNSRVADLGCGTGGQTMILAQKIAGNIVGIDLFSDFIDIFNANALSLNLRERVSGIAGNMEALPFQSAELDLIWSEGVLDKLSFEKNLTYWNGFLKTGGHVSVSSPSWLTLEHPVELKDFWTQMGGEVDSIEGNISAMQRAGYSFVASFALPEKCWTENYFTPRTAAGKAIAEKYPGNKIVEDYIKNSEYEVELYEKYKQHYGYVFYIGKKL